jgi:drug/metabolite transporter (DMT)-like permease
MIQTLSKLLNRLHPKQYNFPPWVIATLFVTMIGLDVLTWVLDKIASSLVHETGIQFYIHLIQLPWIWLLVLIAPIKLWLWTTILSKMELSLSYCLSSVSYPLTMLVSQFLLGEHLNLRVWLGALLITCGVMIMSLKTPANSNTST